jgi:hypothetical protein
MSTLKVTNIQATGETASRAVSGVAAAWVNLQGSGTAVVRDSHNNSSITDNGNGDYTITVSSALANANYAVLHGVSQGEAAATTSSAGIKTSGTGNDDSLVTYSTTATRMIIKRSNGSNEDTILVCNSLQGDLA